jgi:hypothetical protein
MAKFKAIFQQKLPGVASLYLEIAWDHFIITGQKKGKVVPVLN